MRNNSFNGAPLSNGADNENLTFTSATAMQTTTNVPGEMIFNVSFENFAENHLSKEEK